MKILSSIANTNLFSEGPENKVVSVIQPYHRRIPPCKSNLGAGFTKVRSAMQLQ